MERKKKKRREIFELIENCRISDKGRRFNAQRFNLRSCITEVIKNFNILGTVLFCSNFNILGSEAVNSVENN